MRSNHIHGDREEDSHPMPAAVPAKEASGLFDEGSIWRDDPMTAFEALLLSPAFVALGRRQRPRKEADLGMPDPEPAAVRSSSATVYLSMFRSLQRHLDAEGIAFLSMNAAQFSEFLERKGTTSAVRQRYVRLVERVFDHLIERRIAAANPASEAAPHLLSAPARRLPREKPTTFVPSALHDSVLFAALAPMLRHEDWRLLRDAAMAAVLMGAGLKVYELSSMKVSWICGAHPELDIQVPQIGVSRPHRIPLRGFYADCVKAWLDRRASMQFRQPLLFVNSVPEGLMSYVPDANTRPGGPGKAGKRAGAGLDNSTIYRRIKAILAKTGVSTERHGSRSLRNSFAVRELNEGAAPELIEERLGLRDARSISRYVSAAKRDQG